MFISPREDLSFFFCLRVVCYTRENASQQQTCLHLCTVFIKTFLPFILHVKIVTNHFLSFSLSLSFFYYFLNLFILFYFLFSLNLTKNDERMETVIVYKYAGTRLLYNFVQCHLPTSPGKKKKISVFFLCVLVSFCF